MLDPDVQLRLGHFDPNSSLRIIFLNQTSTPASRLNHRRSLYNSFRINLFCFSPEFTPNWARGCHSAPLGAQRCMAWITTNSAVSQWLIWSSFHQPKSRLCKYQPLMPLSPASHSPKNTAETRSKIAGFADGTRMAPRL